MSDDTTGANHIRQSGSEWSFEGEVLRRLTAMEKAINSFIADRAGSVTEMALLTQRVEALEQENKERKAIRNAETLRDEDERRSFKLQLRILAISALASPIAAMLVAYAWTHKG